MNPYAPMHNLICSALDRLPTSVDSDGIRFKVQLTERGVWLTVTDELSGLVFGRKGRTMADAWLSVVDYAKAVREQVEHQAPWPERDALIDFEEVERQNSARYRLAKEIWWCRESALWHIEKWDGLVFDREADLGIARDLAPIVARNQNNADTPTN